MIYRTCTPCSILAPYVRSYWWLESDVGTPYIHRSMADACTEIIFHYKGSFRDLNKGESSFRSGIHGHSERFSRFGTDDQFGIFGVYLYPYALHALFGLPATTVSNQMIDLDLFLGNEGKHLEEKIILADNNEKRVTIMNDYLEKQLKHMSKPSPGITEAIHYLIHHPSKMSVAELSQRYFLSQRQFERNFKNAAGFSPKLFSRIVRFQSAIKKYGSKDLSLTDIAYDCGYYDQSHFIHDFKAFSGHHPRQYFSGITEGTAWME